MCPWIGDNQLIIDIYIAPRAFFCKTIFGMWFLDQVMGKRELPCSREKKSQLSVEDGIPF